MFIRKLKANEAIPFELLLLADESKLAIEKYVFDSDIYIIEKEGRPIAVMVLQELSESIVEIKNVAVDILYQGQGIGSHLINNAISKARHMKFEQIIIGTGDVSFRQLKLYMKLGFKKFDLKRNFFIDNYTAPIFENGMQLKDMIMLKIDLA